MLSCYNYFFIFTVLLRNIRKARNICRCQVVKNICMKPKLYFSCKPIHSLNSAKPRGTITISGWFIKEWDILSNDQIRNNTSQSFRGKIILKTDPHCEEWSMVCNGLENSHLLSKSNIFPIYKACFDWKLLEQGGFPSPDFSFFEFIY